MPAMREVHLTAIHGDYITPPPGNAHQFGHEGTHGKIISDHAAGYTVRRT